MRLKHLFTVPPGQKVTEKALRRVLISSIGSILLCMTCLACTTWAWFAVSIENTGNVIRIGTPSVNVKVNNEVFSSGSNLDTGQNGVEIIHANDLDDLDKKSTLYVTLTINETITVHTTLSEENNYETAITIVTDKPCKLSWEVSWFAPANAVELTSDTITLTAEQSAGPSAEDPSAELSMEPSAEPSTEHSTEPSTEVATEPSTESITEAAIDPAATNPSSEPVIQPEEDSEIAPTGSVNDEATNPTNETTEPVTTASAEAVTDAAENGG